MSDQERIWYVHQEKKQSGPFTSEEVSQMVNEDKILHDAFLFKAGWRDWEPLEGCLKELKLDPSVHKQIEQEKPPERRRNGPRASVSGQIIVHDNEKISVAEGVNISVSGIFFETQEKHFKVGETLKLTCKVKELPKGFNVQAKVVRESTNPKGYGMVFLDIEDEVASALQALIDQQTT